MRSLIALSFIGAVTALAGCKDPREDIVSLHFETESLRDGEIAITKGQGVNIIGVYGKDANKNRIDVSEGLEWSSSDPKLVDVHPLGEGALCIGRKDWFDTLIPPPPPPTDAGNDSMVAMETPDAGLLDGGLDAMLPDEDDAGIDDGGVMEIVPFEPRSDVTVRYGDVEATVPVAVVLNVAGTWQVYLNGEVDKPVAELTFVQNGRQLSDSVTEASGEVHGDRITLMQGALSLEGTLISTTEAAGMSPLGPWQAVRRLDATE